MRLEILDQWAKSESRDTEGREVCYRRLQQLDRLLDGLDQKVTDGLMAKDKIEELKQDQHFARKSA